MQNIYCPVCGVGDDADGRALTTNDKIGYIKHLRTHSVEGLKECKEAAEFVFAAALPKAEVSVNAQELEYLRVAAKSYPALERLVRQAEMRLK